MAVNDSERTLPHNLEAERSILGAVLVHHDALEVAAAIVKPAHFYRDAHQRIFAVMNDLHARRVVPDFVTIKDTLGRMGLLEEVGGPSYIASLADGIPRATNVKYYAGVVAEKWQLREVVYCANRMLVSAYTEEDEASAIITKADRDLLALRGHGLGAMQSMAEATMARFNELEWRVAHKGQLRGIDTGFPSINELTLGLRRGDLSITAARPSIGKTTLGVNVGVNAAQRSRMVESTDLTRVAIFEMEMTSEQLQDRVHAQLSQVSLSRIQTGYIGDLEWPVLATSLQIMHDLPITIDDRPGLTAIDIRTACRRLIAEYGYLDLVVVDYVQLMAGCVNRKGANRNEEIGDATLRLKEMAKELNLHVNLVSQLRRTDGRPRIEDLRESGSLEQIADVVGLLHRKDHRASGLTEYILAKQRNGPTGTVMLNLDRDTTTFTDAPDDAPPPAEDVKAEDQKRAKGRTFASRARKQHHDS